MNVTINSSLEVHCPSREVMAWARKKLTLDNPEYIKKSRMGFWTGNTPQKIKLYKTVMDTLILPFGVLREFTNLFGDSVGNAKTVFSNYPPVDFGTSVELFDYQREAVDVMKAAHFGILTAPPGAGKTQMGIALAVELQKPTLWICHTRDLVSQSRDRARQYISDDLIGTITEGKVNVGKGITFATVQTLRKLDLNEYKYLWDCIIVDECHHVAGSPTSVTQYSKVLNALCARHKYGLTATAHRADNMIAATFALLGDIVYTVPDDAVSDRIMKVKISQIPTTVEESDEYCGSDGVLNYGKLIDYLVNHPGRNALIANDVIESLWKGHSCLILSDRIEHLERLKELIGESFFPDKIAVITGKMSTKAEKVARAQALEDMRTGKKTCLLATYSLAREGLDIPRLDRLFMATPQKDYAVITQSVGRIARVFEGKGDPIATDYVDERIGYLYKAYKKRLTIYRKNGYIYEL